MAGHNGRVKVLPEASKVDSEPPLEVVYVPDKINDRKTQIARIRDWELIMLSDHMRVDYIHKTTFEGETDQGKPYSSEAYTCRASKRMSTPRRPATPRRRTTDWFHDRPFTVGHSRTPVVGEYQPYRV